MSRYNNDEEDDRLVSLHDCYVKRIEWVDNPVFRAFVHHQYPDLFSSEAAEVEKSTSMSYEAACDIWNKNPRFIKERDGSVGASVAGDGNDTGGVVEEDMPDIDAIIAEMKIEDAQTFNESKRDMAKRHQLALNVLATAIVESGDGKRVRVTGQWCTFSPQLPLAICGLDKPRAPNAPRGDFAHDIDATRRRGKPYAIFIEHIKYVSAHQFHALLMETGAMHERVARVRVRTHFDESDEDESGAPAQVGQRPQWATVLPSSRREIERRQRALEAFQARQESAESARGALGNVHRKRVELAELRKRIDERRQANLKKLLRAPFPQLGLRLLLLAQELNELCEFYNNDVGVAIEACARGPRFVEAAAQLLREQPHALCFRSMRRNIGREKKIPHLELLPNLDAEHYMCALTRFVPYAEQDRVIVAAVAVWECIIRADVHGARDGFTIKPSGHKFSVLGADRRALDEQVYHERCDRTRHCTCTADDLRDVDPLGQMGRFVMPENPEAQLTYEQRAMLAHDRSRLRAMGRHGVVSSDFMVRGLHWLVENKVVVKRRFVGTGTHNRGQPFDAFFLAEVHQDSERIVHVVRDIFRRAKRRDVLRTNGRAEVDDPALCALQDMYVEWRDEWRREANSAQLAERARKSRAREAEADAAREQGVDVGVASAVSAAATRLTPAQRSEAAEREARTAVNSSPVAALARKIARCELQLTEQVEQLRAKFAATGCDIDAAAPAEGDEDEMAEDINARDAYADARRGAPIWQRWPMLARDDIPRQMANGAPLSPEQQRACELIEREPIVILTGRGGTGKTEVIKGIFERYNNVVACSFTAQVAAMATRRTGHQWHTIHSLLFRHARYMEAQRAAKAYRRAAHSKAEREGDVHRKQLLRAEEVRECTDIGRMQDYIDARIDANPPYVSPFLDARVVIFEEVSLISQKLIKEFFAAAHDPANGFFIEKVVFVGDLDQLPSIEYGSVLSDLAHGLPTCVCELVVNHRSRGTQLFDLAQAIAEHRFELPMSKFDLADADAGLRNPASEIVALDTSRQSFARRLEAVYETLGAFPQVGSEASEAQSAQAQAQRESMQFLATTNVEVHEANETLRWRIYGEPEMHSTRVQEALRAQVAGGAYEPDARDYQRKLVVKRQEKRIHLGESIYVTRNIRTIFLARQSFPDEPTRERRLCNGAVLNVRQFYEQPRRLNANLYCRCGLCPPAGDDGPKHSECVERLDLVPAPRRAHAAPETSRNTGMILWHDHRWTGRGAAQRRKQSRRMVVMCDPLNNYVEEDIDRIFARRSGWAFGYGLTVHKMQGAQTKTVVYSLVATQPYIFWQALYTAVTRAELRVVMLSSDSVIKSVVRRRAPVRRSALWYDLQLGITQDLRAVNDAAQAAEYERYGVDDIVARWNFFERARYRTDVEPPSQLRKRARTAEPADDDEQ